MIKREIKRVLAKRLEELDFELDRDDIDVEEPSNDEFGDFASNVALELAAERNLSSRDLASSIVEGIGGDLFSSITVAGPGFINFRLEENFLMNSLSQLLSSSDPLGEISVGAKESIQIEFVSSNPTGPLTVGHCRQAVLGDVLAALYRALGYEVETEYYFNDEGRQMDILARTLWARYRQALGK
ncbi:MAG: arginine--tRNA ligase, partial [Candidatus Bipolaricaulia bacterium]